MNRPSVLAIDIGGTSISAALVARDRLRDVDETATPRSGDAESYMDAVVELCAPWRGRYASAALAVTGLVVDGLWSAVNPAILPVPAGYPIVASLEARLGVPVAGFNDAQAAAWGEYRFGSGRGCDMVFITVSTGIGGGMVFGGRLRTGRGGLCGHIGQMTIMQDGNPGRLEDVASGSGLARAAKAVGREADARDILEAADRGETWAEALIDISVRSLALGLASVQMLVDPDCIVIGGGLGLADGYIDRLAEQFASLPDRARPELLPAALGADAGLLGAADLSRSSRAGARASVNTQEMS